MSNINLSTHPVSFECIDSDSGDLVFTVNAFDIHTANVEIKSVVTPKIWPDVAMEILRCLEQMGLEE